MPVKFNRKVVKIGGSFRLTIPKEIVEALSIQEGETVTIWIDNSRMIVEKG